MNVCARPAHPAGPVMPGLPHHDVNCGAAHGALELGAGVARVLQRWEPCKRKTPPWRVWVRPLRRQLKAAPNRPRAARQRRPRAAAYREPRPLPRRRSGSRHCWHWRQVPSKRELGGQSPDLFPAGGRVRLMCRSTWPRLRGQPHCHKSPVNRHHRHVPAVPHPAFRQPRKRAAQRRKPPPRMQWRRRSIWRHRLLSQHRR